MQVNCLCGEPKDALDILELIGCRILTIWLFMSFFFLINHPSYENWTKRHLDLAANNNVTNECHTGEEVLAWISVNWISA